MNRISALKSTLLAAGIALAVVLWMLSGMLDEGSQTPAAGSAGSVSSELDRPSAESSRLISVTVEKSVAKTITRQIAVSARAEPNRWIEIKAETEGRVIRLGAERGARVAEGDIIAELDVRDREARIAEAEALVEQRKLQYDAALRLKDQELISDVQIAEARAQLVSARASLERFQLDMQYTRITAPFDGVLVERSVEIGDYVKSGDQIADVADTDPLIIAGEVSERDVGPLSVGRPGFARLIDGTVVQGRVRYLAPVAEESTRTFSVELAVPNPDGKLRAGQTAEMLLAADETRAHLLSPALLTLDDDGNVGVKAVDESDKVLFYPVEIANSGPEGISVTGLPDELDLITVGQGFVNPGQYVRPVPSSASELPIEDELTDRQPAEKARPGS